MDLAQRSWAKVVVRKASRFPRNPLAWFGVFTLHNTDYQTYGSRMSGRSSFRWGQFDLCPVLPDAPEKKIVGQMNDIRRSADP